MLNKPRRNIVVQTDSGMMIVNRFDFCDNFPGIGQQILNTGQLKNEELSVLYQLLDPIKDSPIVIEIGANIGSHSVGIAEFIYPRNGVLHSFEPQRIVFQMLNGNLAINNIDNVFTHQVAVGSNDGRLIMPVIDYYKPTSFGSVELHGGDQLENYGQQLQYDQTSEIVPLTTIDSFVVTNDIPKVDMMKIDVEGMEFSVLEGANDTIEKFRPVLYIEWWKVHMDDLGNLLQSLNYIVRVHHGNFIGIPIEKQHEYSSLLGAT